MKYFQVYKPWWKRINKPEPFTIGIYIPPLRSAESIIFEGEGGNTDGTQRSDTLPD